jgi:hypothetical protein
VDAEITDETEEQLAEKLKNLRDIKRTLQDIRRFTRIARGQDKRGRGIPRSERRRSRRIRALPLDMRCPVCTEPELRTRRWVYTAELPSGAQLPTPVCRSCWLSGRAAEHFAR